MGGTLSLKALDLEAKDLLAVGSNDPIARFLFSSKAMVFGQWPLQ